MTSALPRYTENNALHELEDVWFLHSVASSEARSGLASEVSVCLMDYFILAYIYGVSLLQ